MPFIAAPPSCFPTAGEAGILGEPTRPVRRPARTGFAGPSEPAREAARPDSRCRQSDEESPTPWPSRERSATTAAELRLTAGLWRAGSWQAAWVFPAAGFAGRGGYEAGIQRIEQEKDAKLTEREQRRSAERDQAKRIHEATLSEIGKEALAKEAALDKEYNDRVAKRALTGLDGITRKSRTSGESSPRIAGLTSP